MLVNSVGQELDRDGLSLTHFIWVSAEKTQWLGWFVIWKLQLHWGILTQVLGGWCRLLAELSAMAVDRTPPHGLSFLSQDGSYRAGLKGERPSEQGRRSLGSCHALSFPRYSISYVTKSSSHSGRGHRDCLSMGGCQRIYRCVLKLLQYPLLAIWRGLNNSVLNRPVNFEHFLLRLIRVHDDLFKMTLGNKYHRKLCLLMVTVFAG